MARWRTQTIALVTLGAAAAATAACVRQPEYSRNGYASREACLKDYPPPPDRCESTARNGYFYGPTFARLRRDARVDDPGPGISANASGVSAHAAPGASVTGTENQLRRAGFGSTGRSYAASGVRSGG